MNNLERKLIEVTFPSVDVNALMEVIEATPNTRVATEILCGIYTFPTLRVFKLDRHHRECTLISYDKWTETVKYYYEDKDMIYEYYPNSINKETIDLRNYKSFCCDYEQNQTFRHGIESGKLIKREIEIHLHDWNKLKDVEVKTESSNTYALAE